MRVDYDVIMIFMMCLMYMMCVDYDVYDVCRYDVYDVCRL